jgi:hypothetical protein
MDQTTLRYDHPIQTTLRYDDLIESHLEHLQHEYRHLLIDDATLPQFWFLTTTFVPVDSKRDDHVPSRLIAALSSSSNFMPGYSQS